MFFLLGALDLIPKKHRQTLLHPPRRKLPLQLQKQPYVLKNKSAVNFVELSCLSAEIFAETSLRYANILRNWL